MAANRYDNDPFAPHYPEKARPRMKVFWGIELGTVGIGAHFERLHQ